MIIRNYCKSTNEKSKCQTTLSVCVLSLWAQYLRYYLLLLIIAPILRAYYVLNAVLFGCCSYLILIVTWEGKFTILPIF